MYSCLYRVSSEVLLMCFSNVMVSWICLYSCIFFRMCKVYADWGSLFFMYLMCSWYCCFKLSHLSNVCHVTGVIGKFVSATFFMLWGYVVRLGCYKLL
jgi:hypothetical protein